MEPDAAPRRDCPARPRGRPGSPLQVGTLLSRSRAGRCAPPRGRWKTSPSTSIRLCTVIEARVRPQGTPMPARLQLPELGASSEWGFFFLGPRASGSGEAPGRCFDRGWGSLGAAGAGSSLLQPGPHHPGAGALPSRGAAPGGRVSPQNSGSEPAHSQTAQSGHSPGRTKAPRETDRWPDSPGRVRRSAANGRSRRRAPRADRPRADGTRRACH